MRLCLKITDAAKMAVCIPTVRTLLGWPIASVQDPDKVLTVGFSELVAWPPIMTDAGLNNVLYKILGPVW